MIWQLIHHVIAHPLIGLSFGRLWTWRFHDYTHARGWPQDKKAKTTPWAGLG